MNGRSQRVDRYILLLGLGSLVHLVLGQVNFSFYDWGSMWYTATHIASGGSLYVSSLEPFYLDGVLVKPPSLQMPLFIYILSVFAFFDSPRLARIFMWVCFSVLTYFLHKNIYEHQYRNWILIIYFFNPICVNITYLGLFDHIPVLLSVLGTHYILNKNYSLAGLFYALGFLSKLYVLYIFVSCVPILIKSKKIIEVTKYMLSFGITAVPLLWFLYVKYGNLLFKISLGYHIVRDDPSLSLWTNWLTGSNFDLYLTISRIFLMVVPFLLAIVNSWEMYIDSIYLWNFSVMWVFLMSLNILLTHYFWWSFIFLILHSQYFEKNKRWLVSIAVFILVFGLFGFLWGSFENYYIFEKITYYQVLSVLNFLSMTLFLVFQYFGFEKFGD